MSKNRGKRGLLGYEEYMPQIDEATQASIDEYASKPEQKGLLGFWQGGDKFTARDGIAGLLAGIGDAFDREGGGDGGALDALIGGRAKAFAEARKQAQQEQLIQAGINAGRSRDEMALITGGAANYGDFKKPNNDTIEDFNWFKSLSPQDRAIYQEMKPVYRQGPDGQFYRVQPSAPPVITDDDWKSGTPITGGTSGAPAGRTFRR